MKTRLYPAQIDFESEFRNPQAVFRDSPFWSWNSKLDKAQLLRQIEVFKEMGMGGFHMHVRTGLQTPYMGEEFMARVKDCVEQAKKDGQKAYLYDEDRWPSGSAGGAVTKDVSYRSRHLRISLKELSELEPGNSHSSIEERSSPEDEPIYTRKFIKCFDLKLDVDGFMLEYHESTKNAPPAPGFQRLYVYLVIDGGSGWFNRQSYISTLNPQAVKKFIELTHERYYKSIGNDFGGVVPSIFTDEPQFYKKVFSHAKHTDEEAILAFCDDIPEDYQKNYGVDFWSEFPEILYDRADRQYSQARYRYHDFTCERFAKSFSDQVGKWCDNHNLLLTGHMMEEPTLESQTHSLGEAMRNYRSFGLPGIDMLCDGLEYSTAKQAQSASRQFGCNGVLSELDGVTGWDFDFAGHKRHGDWQAALGVTLRVPHLALLSMEGESKRDYPASISYQSPWYKKYPVIADHFARVNTALTRGTACCRVGVIHPIESYWLLYGPQDLSAASREQADKNFHELIDILLFGTVDFDFVAESLLPIQYTASTDRKIHVGEMAYDVIVVPPCITLRSTTLTILEDFIKNGGKVIFAGDIATLCDAVKSDGATKLASQARQIPFNRLALLQELESVRDLRLTKRDGYPAENLIYQMRQDGDTKYLFVSQTQCRTYIHADLDVAIRGLYEVENLDTTDGSITKLECFHENGWTHLKYDFPPHGHLLLRLTPGGNTAGAKLKRSFYTGDEQESMTCLRLSEAMPISLDEPNVLLLDRPEFKLASEVNFHPCEDVLRVGNIIRKRFGLNANGGGATQPYIDGAPEILGGLELKYTIDCAVPVTKPVLALEHAEDTIIELDGKVVASEINGYWTDEAIKCVQLPSLNQGKHTIILRYDYRRYWEPEACYLLGDFGVKLFGREATIIEPVRQLAWGNVTTMGLPFYSGNITYHANFELSNDEPKLAFAIPASNDDWFKCNSYGKTEFAGFAGTLIEVKIDDSEAKVVAFSPYVTSLGAIKKGQHRLDITLYGSRRNAFGPPHLSFKAPWVGPGEWRRKGNMFDYTYSLAELGIVREPKLIRW